MTALVALTDWAWLLGLFALVAAGGIYGYVKKQPPGNETMIDIGEQIHDGAMTFLRREYTVLSGFVVVVAILLWLAIGRDTAIAYVFGALSSVAAGFAGMKAATRANMRTAAAANTDGQGKALRIAFFGVQLLDGFETTSANVRRGLVPFLEEAGFESPAETHRERTPFGTLCLYRAAAP